MRTRSLGALLFGVSLSAAAQTLVPPLAPDFFPVNSHTFLDQTAARAVMAADGKFVVTWYSKEDASQIGVWARTFDAHGAPVDEEFQVSQSTVGDQYAPAIAGGSTWNFIIVWQSTFQDGDGSGIYGRRYVAGLPTSDEFLINTETTGNQKLPAVARQGDGPFVVVWESDRPNLAAADILGQRFDASGNKVGPEFQVNTYTPGDQARPAVAMSGQGDFVVTWQGAPGDYPQYTNVFARRFHADGTPDGDQFQLNTQVEFDQLNTSVAMDALGRTAVVWESTAENPFRTEIRGRVLPGPEHLISAPSDASQIQPTVSMAIGRPLVAWHDQGSNELWMRRYDLLDRPGAPFLVHEAGGFGPSIAENGLGRFAVVWLDFFIFTTGIDVFGRIGAAPDAVSVLVDQEASSGTSDRNGILESGETVRFTPTYRNTEFGIDLPLAGALVADPPLATGSTAGVVDGTADYGTLAGGDTGDCASASSDCYEITASRAGSLEGHWDAAFEETLSNGSVKTWPVHVGETFADVPRALPFYSFIEAIVHNGVTAGCAVDAYCADNPVTRAQMAVFLLKGKYGASHVPPPPTGGVFPDVPVDAFAAAWIEELAALGVTSGCGGGNYCPDEAVTRDQMAVFLIKARDGSDFVPPAATGIFDDVPLADLFAPWIEELSARGITGGCQAAPPLYCPSNPNTRGQMAVFLGKTFLLSIYGP